MTERSGIPSPDRSDTPSPDRSEPPGPPPVRWPLWIALLVVTGVWAAGAVWSFREQTALAQSSDFHVPELLPLTIDGFAIAMAAVAWAASLDGRAAVFARFGIGVGIACSAAANAAWAWQRSAADPLTIVLGGGVPVIAMVAFEVLLAEARRQVQRRRGLPAPEAIPWPRLVRIVLAPFNTLLTWRRLVLERTDPTLQFEAIRAATRTAEQASPRTGSGRARKRPAGQAADQSKPGGTVTSIRSADRKKTGRGASSRTGPSEAALRDAGEILDRYDRVPTRNELARQTGWGSPRAGNALKALSAARRQRARAGDSDDEERTSWVG